MDQFWVALRPFYLLKFTVSKFRKGCPYDGLAECAVTEDVVTLKTFHCNAYWRVQQCKNWMIINQCFENAHLIFSQLFLFPPGDTGQSQM